MQPEVCVQLDSVHYTDQTEKGLSDYDKGCPDFPLLEPIATFMCYPIREDAEVDLLTSQIATLFHLNPSAVEDEILTLQADNDIAHTHTQCIVPITPVDRVQY